MKGSRLELEIDSIAHGGHCVARFGEERRVIFVRHALPGERVLAVVTGEGPKGRYLTADAVEILQASPHRVTPPCRFSGPGRCGGCDFQHVEVSTQRNLKADVVRDLLVRIGGLEADDPIVTDLVVEQVEGDRDGLGWRTRMTYAVDESTAALGLRRHHSSDVIDIDRCLLATDAVAAVPVLDRTWPGATSVAVWVTGTGDARVVRDSLPVRLGEVPAGRWVSEAAADRDWKLDARGFWQVHPGAVDALVGRVREIAAVRAGDHVLDLYSGAGLFAAALSSDVDGLQVDAVEADVNAVAGARRSLHDLPGISLHQERVDVWLRSPACPSSADVVVLDPPRAGAGKEVLVPLAALSPRVIAFVACDPAALARDVGILRARGYRLASLRAFDLFPMTHHVECVAEFVPLEPS